MVFVSFGFRSETNRSHFSLGFSLFVLGTITNFNGNFANEMGSKLDFPVKRAQNIFEWPNISGNFCICFEMNQNTYSQLKY